MLLIENLRKRLGRFSLRVDRLEIPAGAYFLLLGPSGSGKTVLLETLAGLNRADEGSVRLEGRDVTAAPPEKRGIGFVYQKGWLFPNLTVERNVRFGLGYGAYSASEQDRIVERLAETMGIGHLLNRLPRKLSGGEAQRVALARALAVRPRLLFLDEPLGPLDPAAREGLAGELKAWHRQFGTTTVHVTHDHVEARMLADRVGVMMDGRLAQSGAPDEVFGRPAGERLARFVGCENIWQGEAASAGPPAAGGYCIIRVRGLTFRGTGALHGPVTVSVRPEEISLTGPGGPGDPPEGENGIAGQVVEISDRGPMVRLVIAAEGVRFAAYETRADARRRGRHTGSPATIVFPASAVHVMPRG